MPGNRAGANSPPERPDESVAAGASRLTFAEVGHFPSHAGIADTSAGRQAWSWLDCWVGRNRHRGPDANAPVFLLIGSGRQSTSPETATLPAVNASMLLRLACAKKSAARRDASNNNAGSPAATGKLGPPPRQSAFQYVLWSEDRRFTDDHCLPRPVQSRPSPDIAASGSTSTPESQTAPDR